MANPNPLQPGDRAPDYSGTDSSLAGDRRSQDENSPQSERSGNAAGQLEAGEHPLFRCGYIKARPDHVAPFEVIETAGDTSGAGTQVRELDIYKYGDDYDPTAPARVRNVEGQWNMDTDFDGQKN